MSAAWLLLLRSVLALRGFSYSQSKGPYPCPSLRGSCPAGNCALSPSRGSSPPVRGRPPPATRHPHHRVLAASPPGVRHPMGGAPHHPGVSHLRVLAAQPPTTTLTTYRGPPHHPGVPHLRVLASKPGSIHSHHGGLPHTPSKGFSPEGRGLHTSGLLFHLWGVTFTPSSAGPRLRGRP